MASDTKIQMRDSDRRHEILATIQKSLTRFAALYNHVPSTVVAGLWFDRLQHLSPAQLAATFERVEETFKPTSACPFPTPAHILELVWKANAEHESGVADSWWDEVVSEISRNYTPDLPQGGLARSHFSDRLWHCIRAAGGAAAIAMCPTADLHFRKSEFIAAWENYSALERDANFLPDGQAKEILAELKQRAQLPS